MTPSKSRSRRRFEADISGRLCCDAGAADFNGRCVKSVKTNASGHEQSFNSLLLYLLNANQWRGSAASPDGVTGEMRGFNSPSFTN